MAILTPLWLQTNSHQWSRVFFGMSACYTFGMIVYTALGSGEVQPWALDEEQLTDATEALTQNIEEEIETEAQESQS